MADRAVELDQKAVIPEHVVYRTFVSETVVLNLQSGLYHGINASGGRMMDLMDQKPTLRDVGSGSPTSSGVPWRKWSRTSSRSAQTSRNAGSSSCVLPMRRQAETSAAAVPVARGGAPVTPFGLSGISAGPPPGARAPRGGGPAPPAGPLRRGAGGGPGRGPPPPVPRP